MIKAKRLWIDENYIYNYIHLQTITDPCNQPIYPPGFVPHCDVLQKQWTYNASTGQCVEFYYHPCGEDRDGYDVFASEEECDRTCLHRGRP